MPGLDTILQYTLPATPQWSIFGSADEFNNLPDATKDQVSFLNKKATDYLSDLLHTARLITGGGWEPFQQNFKMVETFDQFYADDESRQLLKKWLYHRGIPFSNQVFLLQTNENAVVTTWKMILRYSPFIFPGDDVAIFDQTLNWCLFFYHENKLFFVRDRLYDPAEDEQRMQELNERKKKYPQFRHPYF
ncbi:hypothetical protein [Terrimonas ferruginea]|uniref:hypothetical protein n=1 Tax=Terrimonas ferruginea TaxID=249 RepID=UPI000421D7D8|nr:hypothetical protein [Terrimonas ferruginea]